MDVHMCRMTAQILVSTRKHQLEMLQAVLSQTHHSNKRIVSQTYNIIQKESSTTQLEIEMNIHVSQRMGNSLCSHPALLISALGILTPMEVESKKWVKDDGGQQARSNWLAKPESSTLLIPYHLG